MKSMTKLLIGASALTLATAGFAAQPASFDPGTQGFYIGADVGYGITTCDKCSFKTTEARNTISSSSNNGVPATLFGGYQLNQYVALEAGWGALPGVSYKASLSLPLGSGNSSETATATHFYGAIKGMLPLPKRFGLFGKVGYDHMSISSTSATVLGQSISSDSFNVSGILLAAGASYDIKPNLALTLAYNQLLNSGTQSGTTQKINVSYGTLGLTYLF